MGTEVHLAEEEGDVLRRLWGFLIGIVVLAGCGTLSVGIATTATVDQPGTTTAALLRTENADLHATVIALTAPPVTNTLDLIYVYEDTLYRADFDGRNPQPIAPVPAFMLPALHDANGYGIAAAQESFALAGDHLSYGAQGTIGGIDLRTGATTPLYTLSARPFVGLGSHTVQ